MVCDSSRRKRSPRSATGGRCGRRSSERCKRGVVSTGRLPGWNAEACCSDPATEPNGGVDSCRPLIGNGLRTGAPRRWALLGVGWFSELRYRSTAANAPLPGATIDRRTRLACIGAGATRSMGCCKVRRSTIEANNEGDSDGCGWNSGWNCGDDVESVLVRSAILIDARPAVLINARSAGTPPTRLSPTRRRSATAFVAGRRTARALSSWPGALSGRAWPVATSLKPKGSIPVRTASGTCRWIVDERGTTECSAPGKRWLRRPGPTTAEPAACALLRSVISPGRTLRPTIGEPIDGSAAWSSAYRAATPSSKARRGISETCRREGSARGRILGPGVSINAASPTPATLGRAALWRNDADCAAGLVATSGVPRNALTGRCCDDNARGRLTRRTKSLVPLCNEWPSLGCGRVANGRAAGGAIRS